MSKGSSSTSTDSFGKAPCDRESFRISWTDSYTGEVVAAGIITANMEGLYQGWFRIQLGSLDL